MVRLTRATSFGSLIVVSIIASVLLLASCNGDPSGSENNRSPVADAGDDISASVGELCVIDGTGSSDPDGDTIEFSWLFTQIAPGSILRNADIADRYQAAASFTPDVEGTFTLRLNVADGKLEAMDSVDVTVAPPPPATPAGLAVTAQMFDQISLMWSSSERADSYQVYRDTVADGPYATRVYDGAGTSCTDEDLTTSMTYYYKVRATSSHGSSPLSAAVSGFTSPNIPTTPAGLTVTGQTNTTLSLSWNTADGAETYQVYRDTAQFGLFAVEVYSNTSASCTDTDLDPESTYWYKVRATNVSGSSPLSAAAVSGTTHPNPPATPTGLTVDGQSDVSITLSWDASPGSDSYKLYRDPDEFGSFSNQVYVGADTSCLDSSLTPDATYWYKVLATNAGGSSDLSAAVSGTTDAANASLSALTISVGGMQPAFDSQRLLYSRAVSTTTATISVTPTADSPTSTIVVEGVAVDSGSTSDPIALSTGTNEINVDVTSAGGSVTKNYIINVCRPVIDLAVTGQTTSYYTGDDGDHERGASWPVPRFTNNDNGTITDNMTGLMWEQEPNQTTVTWVPAIEYANDLDLGGHTDWRAANIIEMNSLVNAGQVTYTWLQSNGFSNVNGRWYYSGTSISSSSAFTLHSGTTSQGTQGKNNSNVYVFAVRSTSVGLEATGQTTVYETGDDGDYQLGLSLPNPRFTDNGDGTIFDNLTGLMWEQDPNDTEYSWEGALDHANGLELAGYTDWRLPNRSEILSMLNYSSTDQTSWLTGAECPFTGVLGGSAGYWSGTTQASDTTLAASRSFGYPSLGWYDKALVTERHAWAVRGGYE